MKETNKHSVNRLRGKILKLNIVTGEWRGLLKEKLNDLYGCETWSLTLRMERKLRVLETMVLRRIFGPRRDEVTRGMEGIA